MYQIDTRTIQTRAPQLPLTYRNTNPRVSTSIGVIRITNVSRPQLKSTQIKDKVVPYNSQVKFKKTEVEDHHMISSISNKTKSVTVKWEIVHSGGYSTQSDGDYQGYDKRTDCTSSVNKSSSPTYNSKQQDTPPTMNIQSSTEPITPTNVNAEENNDNQAVDKQVQQNEFINPLCTPVREVAESSSCNIDNSNMHTFYQPHDYEYR
ncbi:hypothetical protein Tco_1531302 [Tanacetum coccineum]